MRLMKKAVIFLLMTIVSLVYRYREPLWYLLQGEPAKAFGLAGQTKPLTPREEQVRLVFDRYTGLFLAGDLQSENVYMPDAVFLVTGTDASGPRREYQVNASQHRAQSAQLLPQIKAGKTRIRFEGATFEEQPDGRVRVECESFLNDGPAVQTVFVFVNTIGQRWAIAEEYHRLPAATPPGDEPDR